MPSPFYNVTGRLGLRKLTGESNVSDIGTGFDALGVDIEALLYPPGDLRLTAKSTVDTGWLVCEGQAVSRTTYKALFEAIGTAYGEGDKSTTFNLPDFRERVPMGAGETNKRGAKLGAAMVTLDVAQMPSHSHGGTTGTDSPDHTHNFPNGVDYDIPPTFNNSGTQGVGAATYTTYGANERHTHSISAEGGGEAHNNIQPSTVCNVWIKT